MVPKPGKPAFRYGHPADGRHVGEKGDVIVSLVSGNGSRELPLIFEKSDGSKVVSVSDQPPRLKTSELRARARDSPPFSSWTFSPRIQGLVLLNLVMLACASTFVVLKEGQESLNPFVFSSLRFVIAAVFFSPYWSRAFKDERVVRAGLEIGIWAAGGYLTQSVGMVSAEASRGAFLSAFTVVVVPILGRFFGTSKLKKLTWLSVAAALIGAMLLEDGGGSASWGDFWSFASAILFGVQIYRTEYWSKQCNPKDALPMMSVALLMIAGVSIFSMILTFPSQSFHFLQNLRAWESIILQSSLPWPSILYTGLMVTDLGLWAEVIALQHVSSTEAAIIYTLEPVCGAAFAYFLLGERWNMLGWAGAILIVISSVGIQIYGAE